MKIITLRDFICYKIQTFEIVLAPPVCRQAGKNLLLFWGTFCIIHICFQVRLVSSLRLGVEHLWDAVNNPRGHEGSFARVRLAVEDVDE